MSNTDTQSIHQTVLLTEAVDSLVSDRQGCYVDGTFGRGGHSRLILEKLGEKGFLVGIDKDPDAIVVGKQLMSEDQRFVIYHHSFTEIEQIKERRDISGILLDLGVSSPQLDQEIRGFSFMKDGPLDMRMNTFEGETASEWLFHSSEKEIAKVLKEFGEERFAKRIAKSIVAHQTIGPIKTTAELAKIVADANPAWEKGKNPATRSFQAIRIKVNNELDDLDRILEISARVLKKGGRLVVISFHSLEDRKVKRFMRQLAKGTEPPPGVPVKEKDIVRNFRIVGKAIKATLAEIEVNVRSRSAVMRVLEKTGE